MSELWKPTSLRNALTRVERFEQRDDLKDYSFAGTYSYAKGIFVGERKLGAAFKLPKVQRLKAGDFVYCKIMAWEGAFGTVPNDADGCVMSGAFVAYEPNLTVIEPKFLDWYFRTPSNWQRIGRQSTGTNVRRQSLHPHQFEASEILLPPLDEQRRIVARIESLTEKVQEAIANRLSCEKERAVLASKELTDRRRAISQTYPLASLGSLTRVTSGGTPSRDNPSFWNGDIPWIKTGELLDGAIDSAEEFITDAGLENSSAKMFPQETILVALYGQGQTRGRTGRLAIRATTNQACCAILPCEQLYPPYVQWWMRSLYRELREDAKGGAQPNWSGAMIKDLLIAVPPMNRQIELAREFDAFQSKLDLLASLQTETASELDAMIPAILNKAFNGEL